MFKILQVETTNVCNSHCVFCPHDRFKTFQTMTDAVYKKVVDDAAQYELSMFIPMLTGEPFCDKKIMARVRYARKKLREKTEIKLFTNGSLITEKQVDELAEMPNVKLSVSLNGPDRQYRNYLMGLDDFDKVVQNVRYIYAKGILTDTTTVFFPILFDKQVNALAAFPKPSLLSFHNWAGLLYKYDRRQPTNCIRVQDTMTILASGQAALCCFDPFGKSGFGNVKESTLKEIWGGPEHSRYLQYHSENRGQELPLCKNCTQG